MERWLICVNKFLRFALKRYFISKTVIFCGAPSSRDFLDLYSSKGVQNKAKLPPTQEQAEVKPRKSICKYVLSGIPAVRNCDITFRAGAVF